MSSDGRTVFFLAVAWLLLIGSFGFHLNDEAELGAAAYNLAQGRLTVDEVPADLYRLEQGNWTPRIREVGGHGYISETRASAVLAAPLMLVTAAWALVAPLQLLLVVSFVASSAIAVFAATRLLPIERARRTRLAASATLVLFAAASVPLVKEVPTTWAPVVAVQLSTVLLFALATLAIFLFAERAHSRLVAWTAVALLLFGTTASFWGFGLKYHAWQMAAVAVATWLRFTPGHGRRRHALAYVIAGLAIWSHPKTGGLLLIALALVEGALLLREWPGAASAARRTATCIAALLLGLAPYAIENTLLYGDPTLPGYAVDVEPPRNASEPGGGGTGTFDSPPLIVVIWHQLVSSTAFSDPARIPASLWATWVHPGLVTATVDVQFGLLMLSPLLLAGLAGMLRAGGPRGYRAFALTHLLLFLVVYAHHAATPAKGGYDSRYLTPLFPALAIHAAVMLERAYADRFTRWGSAAAALVLLALGLALFAAPPDYTAQFHHLRRLGLLALGLVAAWLVLGLLRGRVGGPQAWQGLDIALLSMAWVPPVLFVLQFVIHHSPRTIWTDAGPVSQFQPLAEALSQAMDTLLGR